MTIAASNFIEGKTPQYYPEDTKLGTYGSQKLVGMMKYAHGKHVDFYPVSRILLSITDYPKLFTSPGKVGTNLKNNEMLVSSVHYNKTKMYYKK